jgi:5-methylcytosine-specific restriction endonuclease McrA
MGATNTKRFNNASGYHHLYDTALWKRTRKQHLMSDALCVMCGQRGLIVEAKIVDHIKPHKGDENLFFDPLNLQSLCKTCHDSAKKLQENNGYIVGCDAAGNPLDKNHAWHSNN